MRSIRNLLPAALGRDEVLRMARAQRILRRWEEVVGPEMYSRSRPDRYTRGTVWVAVQGSAWAQELRLRKESILQRLAEIGGDATLFTDVRFGQRRLPDIDPFEEPAAEPEGALPRDTTLTIDEIRRRRLAKRRDETSD